MPGGAGQGRAAGRDGRPPRRAARRPPHARGQDGGGRGEPDHRDRRPGRDRDRDPRPRQLPNEPGGGADAAPSAGHLHGRSPPCDLDLRGARRTGLARRGHAQPRLCRTPRRRPRLGAAPDGRIPADVRRHQRPRHRHQRPRPRRGAPRRRADDRGGGAARPRGRAVRCPADAPGPWGGGVPPRPLTRPPRSASRGAGGEDGRPPLHRPRQQRLGGPRRGGGAGSPTADPARSPRGRGGLRPGGTAARPVRLPHGGHGSPVDRAPGRRRTPPSCPPFRPDTAAAPGPGGPRRPRGRTRSRRGGSAGGRGGSRPAVRVAAVLRGSRPPGLRRHARQRPRVHGTRRCRPPPRPGDALRVVRARPAPQSAGRPGPSPAR